MEHKRVLLVEDDRWIADVLVQLVEVAAPGAKVDWHTDVNSAIGAFVAGDCDLVLCDWNLPGQPGIDLVAHARKLAPKIPIIMITGRSDRASVLVARSHGADAFIIKPFQVEHVLALIRRFLRAAAAGAGGAAGEAPGGDVLTYLAELPDAALELPMMHGIRQGLDLLGDKDPPDLRTLAHDWEREPALSTRLLAMANSAAYNQQGQLCANLGEALMRLGWRVSVSVATALALRRAAQLDDPRLAMRAQRQMELADEVGEHVLELARFVRIDPSACHTAALLHRVGELCVLFHLQDWQSRFGVTLEDAQIGQALERFSRPFADRFKAHWRLPMAVRELIGAVYVLLPGTTRQEKYLIRVAGNMVYKDLSVEDEARIRRLAGLL